MQKLVLTFGLIAGAITSALMLATRPLWTDGSGKMDFSTGELLGYATMIVALSMIFFGIKSYRDNHLGGSIQFGKAFKVGILITLVASAVYVAGWMVYYNVSESAQQFPEQYKEYMVEKLQASGKPAAEIAEEVADFDKMMEAYKNPLVMAGVTLMGIFPVGLLITLLSALVLKKSSH